MNRNLQILCILIAITGFSNLQTLNAQKTPGNKQLLKIRSEIEQMVRDKTIPSMAVSVVKDGKIVWQEAIGFADVDGKRKAEISSVYPLGSVSKSITATGVMQLVNDGKLDLMKDVNPMILPIVLRDINGRTPKIKLWQLISMNGGLNHGYGVFDVENDLPLSDEAKKAYFEQTTIIAFQPGTVYEYSNNAFYISELMIENVTKNTFQNFMNEKVFEPLSMKNTYAYAHAAKQNVDLVSTYTNKLEKIDRDIDYPSGGSGFWSSLEDMTNYVMFHSGTTKNPKVINDKNLKSMHEFRQGTADLFGIGWFNNGDVLVSNGNVNGGNSHITIDKKNGLAVVCLLNQTSWDGLADQIAGKIRKVFVKDVSDNGFSEWRRIYGTPYTPRFELDGKWKGHIKQPVTNKTIPVEINFDDTDKISLKIKEKTYELSDPTYNLFNELSGNFKASYPEIYEKESRSGIKLKLTGETLSGYIQYDDFTEKRFYRMPLFIELTKIK